ncbi:bifunctional (p)ppGpp synthetase/guanosine-3',5'-bis(diphosphate) 3'-pyrophosphohydrolase, partial [bacterium]|nr:bifunctional (p)ppGpp synthetase/guanosine-3',5'-bis(diphosphate) 3'-pyrophosphohydrolase [bacterium]
PVTVEEIATEFGSEVALLVDGVTKISGLKFENKEDPEERQEDREERQKDRQAERVKRQAENFRKMLLSMVNDARVILIKFADRLHNMRTIEHLPEMKRKRIAMETIEIYAPLAHRLGIGKIRWELEDLSFKVLDLKQYDYLRHRIKERREEREQYITNITTPIIKELKKAGIDAQIKGRPKHLYSIANKMKKRGLPFEEIYDLLALRIIVKKIEECYYVLGAVHNLFLPIQERFKDYIATPKSNMYQSLHTTVYGPGGCKVEVQIRTEDMNRTAEEGIAAHFRYKEGRVADNDLDRYLVSLRQILDDAKDPTEFMENLKIDLFRDEIFVFTPKGDLVKLPLDATPVDFAFAVHTDVGFHCLGAKVNGRIVSIDHTLHSGDNIEIITSPNQKPNPDWIKFVKTAKARGRIKNWIRKSLFAQSTRLGEEIIAKQLKRLHIKKDNAALEEIAQTYGFSDIHQLYASLGQGDTTIQGIIQKLTYKTGDSDEKNTLVSRFIRKARSTAKGIRVQGVENLLINFPKCCQPVPGDPIIGFITQGRGVVIHRRDCKNILKLLDDPERAIDVEWDVERDKEFMVHLKLLGEDRKGFLKEITERISETDTNIVSAEMHSENGVVHGTFIIEVKNLNHLNRVMRKIKIIPGIIDLRRLNGG